MHYYKIYVNFGGRNKNGYGLRFQSEKDMDDEDEIIEEALATGMLAEEDEEWVEIAEQIEEAEFRS